MILYESTIEGSLRFYNYFFITGVLAAGLVLFNHFKNKIRPLIVTVFYSVALFIGFSYVASSMERFYIMTYEDGNIILTYPSKVVYLEGETFLKSTFGFQYENTRRSSTSTCSITIITDKGKYISGRKGGGCKSDSKRINKFFN